ncbi:pantetheine-phosphate adenylyltransferase [Candidatus Uabimicrobium amorphum]|uniref:Phosphopantetheine adenylyltransferase n=1 Tax=Uabimicrobium amorphum TaxID=2596890 RepID=A0A5S9IKB9_UABAM|nr:pantetheine-phosphate adenylyltransferase [Candidatus Uabimicrobium amorphum]BBM83294.1 phosphopantetheine adenylyltransferase [Candidatus Uabimicrobium amorphum]
MERVGLYAGSFNPPTKGHLDIISRACNVCDRLIVGVGINMRKKAVIKPDERVQLLEKATAQFTNVTVATYEGLTVDYANNIGVNVLIRGLRNPTDFHMEFHMAVTNKTLSPNLETLFLMSTPNFAFVNSYLVREVAASGGDIDAFLPEEIIEDVKQIFAKRMELLKELF